MGNSLIQCFLLILGLMLSALIVSCGGVTNKAVTFTASPTPTPSATSSGGVNVVEDSRTWRTAVNIDTAAVTSPSPAPATSPFVPTQDSGSGGIYTAGPTNLYLPPQFVASSDDQIFAGFTMRADSTVSYSGVDHQTAIFSYPISYSNDTWIDTTSYYNFSEIAYTKTVAAAVTDPFGVYGIWFAKNVNDTLHSFIGKLSSTNTDYRLYAATHLNGDGQSGGWNGDDSIQELTGSINSQTITQNAATNGTCVPKMASMSGGKAVAVWCGVNTTPTNVVMIQRYDPTVQPMNSRWSTQATLNNTNTSISYLGTTYTTPLNSGVDVAIDASSGLGAIASVYQNAGLTKTAMVLQYYDINGGITGSNLIVDTVTGATNSFGGPTLWRHSDGSMTLFYIKVTATTFISLWRADISSSGFVTALTQVDSADTSISASINSDMVTFTSYMREPQLVTSGNYAAYVFTKPSTTGGHDHLWVSYYNSSTGTWSSATTVDDSSGNGVGWFSVAINPSASSTTSLMYLFAYESLDAGGSSTGVKARVYNNLRSAYTPETSLGTTLTSLNDARPTAFMTAGGKIGVGFVGVDSTSQRRIYFSSYR